MRRRGAARVRARLVPHARLAWPGGARPLPAALYFRHTRAGACARTASPAGVDLTGRLTVGVCFELLGPNWQMQSSLQEFGGPGF